MSKKLKLFWIFRIVYYSGLLRSCEEEGENVWRGWKKDRKIVVFCVIRIRKEGERERVWL